MQQNLHIRLMKQPDIYDLYQPSHFTEKNIKLYISILFGTISDKLFCVRQSVLHHLYLQFSYSH